MNVYNLLFVTFSIAFIAPCARYVIYVICTYKSVRHCISTFHCENNAPRQIVLGALFATHNKVYTQGSIKSEAQD
jgi:hypothetical protein